MNLLLIFNIPTKYRAPIYQTINREYVCKWIFGNDSGDIKLMDTSILNDVTTVQTKTFIKNPLYQLSLQAYQVLNMEYDALILIGEPFNITAWKILILNKILLKKKKIFLWSHGWYGRESFAKKWMKRVFFGLADKTFLYGNYAKEVAISQGFRADKLAVIHNSLDHDNQVKLRHTLKPSSIYRDHFENDYPTLIFIGRLTSVKRLDLLLNALAILKSERKNYNLVLVGDGEMKISLESITKEKGLEKVVWFYGACYDDTQNAQLIYDADLCVAPGNVGLTAMHTMVFGTPVLTHDNFTMQMPEFEAIHPGITGDFFKYNDVKSLSTSISNWLETNANNRNEIRNYCFNEIDQFWTPKFQASVLKSNILL